MSTLNTPQPKPRVKPIDYNKLARNPKAWDKQAKEVLMKLSNLPNASKVEPPLYTYEILPFDPEGFTNV